MKEIVVISGKGGTGKTSVTAALWALAAAELDTPPVIADCDVDASNLHLLLTPCIEQREDFFAGEKATIDPLRCERCGRCARVCHFEAIAPRPDGIFEIDPIACEGCGACLQVCPAAAIAMTPSKAGECFVSRTRFGAFFHARLGIAEENSGKLVSHVRRQARAQALRQSAQLLLVDGPPGIGCPVIAAISGAQLLLVVAEPTLSGIHDTRRALELARHFSIPAKVCINKCDINPELARQLRDFCARENIEVSAQISYDDVFLHAMRHGLSVPEYAPQSAAARQIKSLWQNLFPTPASTPQKKLP